MCQAYVKNPLAIETADPVSACDGTDACSAEEVFAKIMRDPSSDLLCEAVLLTLITIDQIVLFDNIAYKQLNVRISGHRTRTHTYLVSTQAKLGRVLRYLRGNRHLNMPDSWRLIVDEAMTRLL